MNHKAGFLLVLAAILVGSLGCESIQGTSRWKPGVADGLLEKSGLAVKARMPVISGRKSPIVEGTWRMFRPTDGQITWWGMLDSWKASWGGVSWGKEKESVHWFDAQGALVAETPIEHHWLKDNPRFAKSTLILKERYSENQLGEWRVEVRRGGQLIDKRIFSLESLPEPEVPELPSYSTYKSPLMAGSPWVNSESIPIQKVALLVFPKLPEAFSVQWKSGEIGDGASLSMLKELFPMDDNWLDPRTHWKRQFGYILNSNGQLPRIHTRVYRDTRNAFYRTKFPLDISEKFSRNVEKILLEHGFQTMDLTPYRRQFKELTYYEILELAHKQYGARGILFLGYIANSHSLSIQTQGTMQTLTRKLGLNMTYEVSLLDADSGRPLFEYKETLSALPKSKVVASVPTIPLDSWGQPIKLEPGSAPKTVTVYGRMIDPEWLIDRILNRFRGESYGTADLVQLGGNFDKQLLYAALKPVGR